MLDLTHDTFVEQTPRVVFDVAADPFIQLKWDADGMLTVENRSDGPLSQGWHYRRKWRKLGVFDHGSIEYDPPRRLAHDATLALGQIVHTMTLDSSGARGTRCHQHGVFHPKPAIRLLAPLLKPLFRHRLVQIGEEPEEYLESPSPVGGWRCTATARRHGVGPHSWADCHHPIELAVGRCRGGDAGGFQRSDRWHEPADGLIEPPRRQGVEGARVQAAARRRRGGSRCGSRPGAGGVRAAR